MENVVNANSQFAALQGAHRTLGRADNALLVFGHAESGEQVLVVDPLGNVQASALPAGFQIASVVADPERRNFYALTAAGLAHSSDGVTWNAINAPSTPDVLLAVSSAGIYGMKDGTFCSSADGGQTWQADEADEPDSLPVKILQELSMSRAPTVAWSISSLSDRPRKASPSSGNATST